MPDRDGYPPGVPCWVDTTQPDPEGAVAFYGGLFGWEFEDRMPADAPVPVPRRASARSGRCRDRIAAGRASSVAVWNTYIAVDKADAAAAKVKHAGGSILVEPFDVLNAGRMAVFSDPSGAVASVWQAQEHKGAQLVNHPGTWNWSDLNTRDPEGAKAFYGAVFGWEANTVDLDGFEGTMLRMPGYAEFLEVGDPDLRRRQADAGAPSGFEDAVAWSMPMTSEQFPDDVPPHWSITFAVDDTDAVVDKVADLGGKVVSPAFDVGVVRVAVLSDPQGAVFTVSKYDPN